MAKHQIGKGIGNEHRGKLEIPVTELASGAIPPAPVTRDNFQGYAYSLVAGVGDESNFSFEVPKDWFIGTDMNVIFGWAINEAYAAANGEVNWQLDWESVANDESQLIGTGTAGNATSGDINIPTLALQQHETTIAIDDGDLTRDDLVRCRLERIDIATGVDPTAEPEIYSVRVEYTRTFDSSIRQ